MRRVAHEDAARTEIAVRRSTVRTPEPAAGLPADLARLQRAAGNRAVAAHLDRVVQRHLEPTMPAEVGQSTETTDPSLAEPTTTNAVEPGTGTGTGTGGTAPATPSRQAQVYAKLNTTDTGRWALGVIDKWKIPVDYNFAGVGSFHQAGKIFVNRSLSIDAATLVTMHEAQHADTFKSGRAADVSSLPRADYIAKKIADEAEAVVRQIEGSVPMTARGASLAGSGITQGLIDRYRAAFYAKRDQLEAADPTMSRAEINRLCRIHARDTEVTSWFTDGTFVTSTGGAANVTYSQHYGKTWDDARTPPSPAPAGGAG
ncbi:hypothetical protein [Nakamurella multipartita]|jgi:hypothetical protein|uniref:Uncharacterized protein n=1 Tax=Nakamurella multipartita (strain ATCC 700099 / DSM 44233 / CIP 104796 / JCM 9543 / NBRC 105858 / Y-104) TaxID=479431 RepID=C8X9N9_NAKMY|nr:hypothetical protein [Nakamurella multipartita]ACV79197.1 hypothetical protein Namu_2854 [Nakamurella multipartita DSM 44233]